MNVSKQFYGPPGAPCGSSSSDTAPAVTSSSRAKSPLVVGVKVTGHRIKVQTRHLDSASVGRDDINRPEVARRVARLSLAFCFYMVTGTPGDVWGS